MKGKLIVFEGTDGSGKATQARMMAEHLKREGIKFSEIDFPRYGNPFAEPARLYLQGVLGDKPGDVSAYAASVLYAVDRFASYMRKMCDNTQFIVVTHRRGTMEEADILYGVTMQEKGVSKLLKLNVSEVEKQKLL